MNKKEKLEKLYQELREWKSDIDYLKKQKKLDMRHLMQAVNGLIGNGMLYKEAQIKIEILKEKIKKVENE